ncbi:hypothetical protein FHS68_002782 [Dyadobacter arcticus]|uniref:Uncharacterized protein n=1 Tax=Dyadobacter arcticus TaxID=1078754 RepID=A0ABX0UPX3_9BACT|nr:hypothetical protein [Dyadobacter arcticus]
MTSEEKKIEAIKTQNSPFVKKKMEQMRKTLALCPIPDDILNRLRVS